MGRVAACAVPVSRVVSSVHGRLAIAGVAVALAVTAGMHLWLSDRVSPIWHTLSDYVHGGSSQAPGVAASSVLFVVMCFALAFGSLALLAGIASRRGQGGAGVFVFLGLWCAGLLVVAVFPVDPAGAARTLSGDVHNFAALLAFLALPSGAWVLTMASNPRCPWTRRRRLIRWLAGASVAATVAVVSVFLWQQAMAPGRSAVAIGLCERLLFAIDLALLLVMIRPLLRPHPADSTEPVVAEAPVLPVRGVAALS